MATLFTRILNGELPGHFVYKDEVCGVFMSIAPLTPGHALVVPRQEADHWIDLPAEVLAHLSAVSQKIARAQQRAFKCRKVGVIIAGLEVPHTHIHLVPMQDEKDLNFANAKEVDQEELQRTAALIREALAE